MEEDLSSQVDRFVRAGFVRFTRVFLGNRLSPLVFFDGLWAFCEATNYQDAKATLVKSFYTWSESTHADRNQLWDLVSRWDEKHAQEVRQFELDRETAAVWRLKARCCTVFRDGHKLLWEAGNPRLIDSTDKDCLALQCDVIMLEVSGFLRTQWEVRQAISRNNGAWVPDAEEETEAAGTVAVHPPPPPVGVLIAQGFPTAAGALNPLTALTDYVWGFEDKAPEIFSALLGPSWATLVNLVVQSLQGKTTKKVVVITGPRNVGKSTVCLALRSALGVHRVVFPAAKCRLLKDGTKEVLDAKKRESHAVVLCYDEVALRRVDFELAKQTGAPDQQHYFKNTSEAIDVGVGPLILMTTNNPGRSLFPATMREDDLASVLVYDMGLGTEGERRRRAEAAAWVRTASNLDSEWVRSCLALFIRACRSRLPEPEPAPSLSAPRRTPEQFRAWLAQRVVARSGCAVTASQLYEAAGLPVSGRGVPPYSEVVIEYMRTVHRVEVDTARERKWKGVALTH